ncbi:DUF2491 family protein [Stenotrophomonas rhizophila]|jgi:hypothetical protein|uniref:DUF2491 family protein n=1 Tax=Stenotrophomonas rhizophila TaxID=216778 RepID=UPI0028D02AC7|nr:DUF2491 family protein [Stenotrophomonas rhizophila]
MSLFNKLFGSPASPPSPASAFRFPLPLGVRIGAHITFDRTMYQVAPGAMLGELPEGYQGIPCIGQIDLGDGTVQHRCYVDDDAYLMVQTVGGDVDGLMGFCFAETVNPPNKHAFQAFILEHAHLGAAEIDYAGKRWQRQINTTAAGRIPPMVFDETLYRYTPARQDGDLTHYAMMYQRHVPELGRDEFLLVTAEDSGPTEFCITYAVGVDLGTEDFQIT